MVLRPELKSTDKIYEEKEERQEIVRKHVKVIHYNKLSSQYPRSYDLLLWYYTHYQIKDLDQNAYKLVFTPLLIVES